MNGTERFEFVRKGTCKSHFVMDFPCTVNVKHLFRGNNVDKGRTSTQFGVRLDSSRTFDVSFPDHVQLEMFLLPCQRKSISLGAAVWKIVPQKNFSRLFFFLVSFFSFKISLRNRMQRSADILERISKTWRWNFPLNYILCSLAYS